MNVITDFMNKWGTTIMVFLGLIVFFNTCGTQGKITSLKKEVSALKEEIHYNDSIEQEIRIIENEIKMNETCRQILYDWNAVVRTVNRPDDIMNQYSQKITELQKKLENTKNAKR